MHLKATAFGPTDGLDGKVVKHSLSAFGMNVANSRADLVIVESVNLFHEKVDQPTVSLKQSKNVKIK